MTYKQSQSDLCLHYSWVDNALVVFVAWAEDVMVLVPPLLVEQVQYALEKAFTCKRKGELTKNIGNKLNLSRSNNGLRHIKFTQPVLVRKLKRGITFLTALFPRILL